MRTKCCVLCCGPGHRGNVSRDGVSMAIMSLLQGMILRDGTGFWEIWPQLHLSQQCSDGLDSPIHQKRREGLRCLNHRVQWPWLDCSEQGKRQGTVHERGHTSSEPYCSLASAETRVAPGIWPSMERWLTSDGTEVCCLLADPAGRGGFQAGKKDEREGQKQHLGKERIKKLLSIT